VGTSPGLAGKAQGDGNIPIHSEPFPPNAQTTHDQAAVIFLKKKADFETLWHKICCLLVSYDRIAG
jgi:hypothetical protein